MNSWARLLWSQAPVEALVEQSPLNSPGAALTSHSTTCAVTRRQPIPRGAVLELGVDCLRVKAQVGDLEKIGMLFEAIAERYGRLDILINNAASGVQRAAVDLDPKHWDWTMAVNARAPWLCGRGGLAAYEFQGAA